MSTDTSHVACCDCSKVQFVRIFRKPSIQRRIISFICNAEKTVWWVCLAKKNSGARWHNMEQDSNYVYCTVSITFVNVFMWCSVNDLQLNATKSKELILDFRKGRSRPAPTLHLQRQCGKDPLYEIPQCADL